jgi:outer membrane protein assembly factor BamD
MRLRKLFQSLLALSSVLLFAGCDNTKQDPFAGYAPNYIYAVGHHALQNGHWAAALDAYHSLDSQYPFDPYTQKGDLDSIYADYQNNDPALALTEAARYIKIYPTDVAGVAYSYYMMGVVNFDDGRGFLQRYFPYQMSQHNAHNYVIAYNNFNTLLTNYPNSPYSADARRRMIYINNVLAQFNMNVANFSYQQEAYVAAANRAINVILTYPTSPVTEDALEMMIQCYEKLGLTDLTASTRQVLELNFPEARQARS